MKKLAKNSIKFVVVTNMDDEIYIEGKGRNSVAQKLFGCRAFVAIETGLAKSITRVNTYSTEEKRQ